MGSRLCIKCGRLNDDAGYNYCSSCYAEVSDEPRMPSIEWDKKTGYNPKNEERSNNIEVVCMEKIERNVKFGNWIKDTSEKIGISYKTLSQLTGVNEHTLEGYVYAWSGPTQDNVAKIEKVLGEYPIAEDKAKFRKAPKKKAVDKPVENTEPKEEIKIPESIDEMIEVIEADLASEPEMIKRIEAEPDDDIFETVELRPDSFVKPEPAIEEPEEEDVIPSYEESDEELRAEVDELKQELEQVTEIKNNYSDTIRILTEKNEALEHKLQKLNDENDSLAHEVALLDSEKKDGSRHFATGAVRDAAKGKGRFDVVDINALQDLDEVLFFINKAYCYLKNGSENADYVCRQIIGVMASEAGYNAILHLGKVAEKGAEHYGENNWKKGIPFSSYIDSAIRHWCKYKQGWEDEDHLGSAMWNIMALHWSINNNPELNDLRTER